MNNWEPDPSGTNESGEAFYDQGQHLFERRNHAQQPATQQLPPAAPTQPPAVMAANPVPPRAYPRLAPMPAAPTRRGGPGWLALFIACLATAALTLGATLGFMPDSPLRSLQEPAPVATVGQTPTIDPDRSNSGGTDWEKVAQNVRPAVVAIQVNSNRGVEDGSGVIFDSSGYILTNHHVIASGLRGGQITISLADGRLFKASIVGSDPATDLAVIRFQDPPGDLVSAPLGSSEKLRVGQPVAAIGNPLGLSSTMTTGIISALDRPVVVSGESNPRDGSAEAVVTNAIQVDAAINPGNSGGPLFDATGKVIGINSSIATLSATENSGGSIGLGFAIPVDLARMVANQLVQTGRASHSYLGVSVTPGSGEANGQVRTGAQVSQVVAGSAAQKAGLRKGDLIVAINGERVGSGSALTGYIRRFPVGSEVEITYYRGGKEQKTKAKLGQLPTER